MKLNPIISSGAVFEENMPVVVFGEAHGRVTGEFSGEVRSCDADGKFLLEFSPRKAGGPYVIKISCCGESEVLTDIMIGKVILLSGQSNAELPVKYTSDRDSVFEDNPLVRLFQVNKDVHIEAPSALTPDVWTPLKKDNAAEWSAIALRTALYYNEKLGIPVGIIGGYQGASVIESFMSEETAGCFDIDGSRIMEDHFLPQFAEFNATSYLYHHIIEKIIPYRISSVIWYQGESNTTEYEGTYYDKMLISLVREWRQLFEKPDLPFVIVQINGYPDPPSAEFKAIQRAQERAVIQIPDSALVVISDLGEYDNIHPENKREVSARICMAIDRLEI